MYRGQVLAVSCSKVVRVSAPVIGTQSMTREPVISNDSVPGVPKAEMTEYSRTLSTNRWIDLSIRECLEYQKLKWLSTSE